MQITLMVDGEEKVFQAPFVKGRMLREAIKLSKSSNFDDLDVEDLDALVGYVVRVYDEQFDIDQFYDGISSEKLIPTITETIQQVVGTVAVPNEQVGENKETEAQEIGEVKN